MFEFHAQGCEVIESSDEWHTPQPFILERLDDAFSHGDGSMLANGSEARFDVPLLQEFGKDTSGKDTGLVRDDVFGWAMFLDGLFQGLDNPAGEYFIGSNA